MEALQRLIREVPNFPTPGVHFYDITPMLADARAFAACVAALGEPFGAAKPTHIVGIESRGFIFGAALAQRLGIGFVPVRKPGKLPRPTYAVSYSLEYGRDTLHLHEDALGPQDRVLIVDDVVATGGTLAATVELVRHSGATILGAATCIELPALRARDKLEGLRLHTLLAY